MAYFENLTLEKGMYGVPGKSFTQVLEELDSSEQYRGTPSGGPGRLPAAAQAVRHPGERARF